MKISDLSPQRLALYFMIFCFLPLGAVLLKYSSQKGELNHVETMIDSVKHQVLIQEKKQAQNNALRNYYRDVDHFYIDKYLESMTFLEPEIESLQKITSNQNIGQTESITKRLEFLTNPTNNLQFTEGVVQTYPYFQETMETLTHPVEVDSQDIEKILSVIEGVEIGGFKPGPNKPQLIVTEFKIDRKKIREDHEIFQLQLKLLKREFL